MQTKTDQPVHILYLQAKQGDGGNEVKGKNPEHQGRVLTSSLYIFLQYVTGRSKCVTFMMFKIDLTTFI